MSTEPINEDDMDIYKDFNFWTANEVYGYNKAIDDAIAVVSGCIEEVGEPVSESAKLSSLNLEAVITRLINLKK